MAAGTAAPIWAMRGMELRLVTGMIPGTTGLSMPRAASSSTSRR